MVTGAVSLSVRVQADAQVLAGWLRQSSGRAAAGSDGKRASGGGGTGGLRFALYGRLSTARFQHQASSRAWQREAADDVIARRSVIVVEYFDVGCSRRIRWASRPEAAALLAALADPGRTFVMMRDPPSCLGQLGCEGHVGVMGCVESVGRAVEAWHLTSKLFPAGSRMNTA
jgi:hypothetical protein